MYTHLLMCVSLLAAAAAAAKTTELCSIYSNAFEWERMEAEKIKMNV